MPTESQLSCLSGDLHKRVDGIVSGMADLGSALMQATKAKHVGNASSRIETETDTTEDIPQLDGTSIPELDGKGVPELDGTAVDHHDVKKSEDKTTVVVSETSTRASARF